MSRSKSIVFSNELEESILRIVNSGQSDFNEILKILPSVYPTTVLKCIKKLISEKHIGKNFLEQLFYNEKLENTALVSKPTFRIPHPLDYHWKFSRKTCNNLLSRAYKLTNPGNVIGLIGAPSLLEKPHDFFDEREVISIDKNPLDPFTRKYVRCTSYTRDLLIESVPEISTNLIIVDPPWYTEYYKSFLWASSKICATNGHILLSVPPEGIRPGIKGELEDIFDFASKAGFSCIGYEKKTITYNMPQFERNALMASGLKNIDANWRTADLATLTKTKQISTSRPLFKNTNNWFEIILDSIVLRVKEKDHTEFKNPTLVPLVNGDIFSSISRRDSRRDLIDVWTSGNRVYLCQGTHILICILKAIQERKSPIKLVSKMINRKLNSHEIRQVLETTTKIKEIVSSELSEL